MYLRLRYIECVNDTHHFRFPGRGHEHVYRQYNYEYSLIEAFGVNDEHGLLRKSIHIA